MTGKVAPEIVPLKHEIIQRAEDLKLRKLFASLFLLLAIPALTFLQRGIRTNVGCHLTSDACQQSCADYKKEITDRIFASDPTLTEYDTDRMFACVPACDVIFQDCTVEAWVHIIATICVAGCFACAVWLVSLLLSLLILQENRETQAPKKKTKKKRNIMGRMASCDVEKMTALAKAQEMKQSEQMFMTQQEIEDDEEDRQIWCGACNEEFSMDYVRNVPRVSWSTSCLTSPPLYCPKCYNVQYGFV